MNISTKFRAFASCLVLASMLCVTESASTATITMLNIVSTGARNYSETAIWPAGNVPDNDDQPVVDNGDGIIDYVYVDANTTIDRFNVGNAVSGGLEIRSGATLTTDLGGTNQTNVGQNGIGHLRIKSGATLAQAGLMNIGLQAGNGTVTLENGATHTLGAQLQVGGAGTGTYNMLGGSLTASTSVLVAATGTGTYNMLGGSLTITTFLQVASGANANGAFKQSAGALQINRTGGAGQQGLHIATTVAGTGLYEISGGSLTIADTNPGIINGTPSGTGTGSFGTFRIVGSAPTINVGTDYTQRSGSKLDLVIDAGGVSLLNLGRDAFLNGALSASFTTVPTIGQEFQIIKYAGMRTGAFATFDSLVDSPLGPDTVQLAIDYGSGTNDFVKLTVVPEPSSILLLGSLGLMLLVHLRSSRSTSSAAHQQ